MNGLKTKRTEKTEGRVAPLAIVENFNVLKDSQPRFGAGEETAVNARGLEGGEEAFHHGIVKRVACARELGGRDRQA